MSESRDHSVSPPRHAVPITDVAEYIRSKNAGPFRFTLDIMFRERTMYERVRVARAITPEMIAAAYGISVDQITDFVYFDPGKAVKITFRRLISSGSPGDTDVYGAQQHAPLLGLVLSLPPDDTESHAKNRGVPANKSHA
jgi:hypothetical protein